MQYFERMRSIFGWKFIAIIFITYCLLKGAVMGIMMKGLFPYFKNMGVDGIQFQIYGAIALSPWTIKPLFGILSDLIAFVGYKKKFTMLASCFIGVTGCAMLVVDLKRPILTVLFVFLSQIQLAICDLLVEGKYAEKMREHPETSSDIVTLANLFQSFGYVLCMFFLAPLADGLYFRIIFSIALGLSVVPIVPIFLNWLPEVPIPNAPYVLIDTKRIKNDWKIITLVIITGISAPAMAAIAGFAAKWLGVVCSLGVILVCMVGTFWAMPNIIARVALYQVLAQMSKVSFGNVLDYFFTADPLCLPGGPNFTQNYYIFVTGIIGGVVAIFTGLLYQFFFSKWKFRSVLIFTSILSAVAGIFDYIIVKRWNLLIGIPDHIFFLIGDAVFETLVTMLYWIPSSSIIGKVCPKDMESSTYAFLAGVANFGTMVSTILGAVLADWFGIVTIGACNWDNLAALILFGHIMVMLIISVPAAFLIPNVEQDVDLLNDEPQQEKKEEQLTTHTMALFWIEDD